MTETARWLIRRRGALLRRETAAVVLVTMGLVAGALAVGVALERAGLYRRLPELVLLGWLLAGAALAVGVAVGVRRARRLSAMTVAGEVERGAALRRGSMAGLTLDAVGSDALAGLADRRAAAWLSQHGDAALGAARAARLRSLRRGAVMAAVGVTAFTAAGPVRGGHAFWQPLGAIALVRGPVTLAVSSGTVRRGDSVTVTVAAAGRGFATLFDRETGEQWRSVRLPLDSVGEARVILGPLESDRFLHATSRGRGSDTVMIGVAVPAFVSDLALVARYPAYLERGEEPLVPGDERVPLPVGTQVVTRGRLTVPLAGAAWQAGRNRTAPLAIDGTDFTGVLTVTRSAEWTLQLTAANGAPLEGEAPVLRIAAVPDSAPLISVPVPGGDTTASTTLRQPLVIDVRDDHRVQRVEVVSRRVSRLGLAGAPVTAVVPLPAAGVERAVLQWLLDLNARGFLPGDTAYFKVRAIDNAPTPHVTETREFALRLPSMSELREATRAQTRGLAAAADSLVRRQDELSRRTEELAAERDRGASAAGAQRDRQQLDFRAAERAGEVSADQREVLDRAQALRERLDDLEQAAWNAGLTDPEWHRQLEDLRDLIDRAITPELEQVLAELQEAMQRLDAPAVREALERLAEAQQALRRQLERSRTLFERAALEGEMTTLADDAAELAERQREWNDAVRERADSTLGAEEDRLAEQVDSLADRLEQLEQGMGAMDADGQAPRVAPDARAAEQAMRRAAAAASQGDPSEAGRQGRQASARLDPMAQSLEDERDRLRDAWRREVLEAMDHALSETAQLADQQRDIHERLSRGDASADLRSAQAAARDGVDRVTERLLDASGKNALVAPRLAGTLGLAKLKMTEALGQLQQANPNTSQAGSEAGDALDALNALAYQLLRSRADVAGAASGSGLQEALERMAQLAQQQNAMAGQAGGMLPLMPGGGQMLLQELRRLARQQRALADELERLRAEGDRSGAGELADEARELARELEAGVLNREMVERQERLYRRLLDAGRTLRGTETDDQKERVSATGRDDTVVVPESTAPVGTGPRFPYPSWEELQRLSPEERRLILDYFRRLNDALRR